MPRKYRNAAVLHQDEDYGLPRYEITFYGRRGEVKEVVTVSTNWITGEDKFAIGCAHFKNGRARTLSIENWADNFNDLEEIAYRIAAYKLVVMGVGKNVSIEDKVLERWERSY